MSPAPTAYVIVQTPIITEAQLKAAYVITVQTPIITEAQLKAILDLFDTNNAILISLTKL